MTVAPQASSQQRKVLCPKTITRLPSPRGHEGAQRVAIGPSADKQLLKIQKWAGT